jgi:hypothetical protein
METAQNPRYKDVLTRHSRIWTRNSQTSLIPYSGAAPRLAIMNAPRDRSPRGAAAEFHAARQIRLTHEAIIDTVWDHEFGPSCYSASHRHCR